MTSAVCTVGKHPETGVLRRYGLCSACGPRMNTSRETATFEPSTCEVGKIRARFLSYKNGSGKTYLVHQKGLLGQAGCLYLRRRTEGWLLVFKSGQPLHESAKISPALNTRKDVLLCCLHVFPPPAAGLLVEEEPAKAENQNSGGDPHQLAAWGLSGSRSVGHVRSLVGLDSDVRAVTLLVQRSEFLCRDHLLCKTL